MMKALSAPLLAFMLLAGCSSPAPQARATVTYAVFPLKLEELRLPRETLETLDEHATRMMQQAPGIAVVPREQLHRASERKRGHRDRHCASLPCQLRVGGQLGATRSLIVEIMRDLLGQCDVIAKLYQSQSEAAQGTATASAGCSEEELGHSLGLALCRLLDSPRGASAPGGPNAAPSAECLARGEFLWVDAKLEGLMRPSRQPRRARRPQTWEERMAEQVLQLKREYDGIARYGVPRWALLATCRSGRLYEHFAQQALAGGQSGSLPEAARKERAAPFVEKARQLYRECLDRAQAQHLAGDPRVVEAGNRLRALPATTK